MAETTNSTTQSTGGAATPKRSGTTRRSTARKAPAKTTARRSRTTAKRQTTQAAQANTRAAKQTAKQGGVSVERYTLIGLGAALEARDRVVGFATDWYETFAAPLASRDGVEKQIRKFERRGTSERNRIERRAKTARTRVERGLRSRRRDAERIVRRNRTTVQNGVVAGEKAAKQAVEQLTSIA
jgi:hypothetical protein